MDDLEETSKPEDEPVAQSIEKEKSVVEEDEDAPGEDDDVAPEKTIAEPDGKVTNEHYKAFKAICDTLYNHRVTRRGDE